MHLGWNLRPTAALRTAKDKCSGGCGVATGKHVGIANNTDEIVPAAYRHRIAVTWVGAILKGGVHVLSVWLKDSEGLSEKTYRSSRWSLKCSPTYAAPGSPEATGTCSPMT